MSDSDHNRAEDDDSREESSADESQDAAPRRKGRGAENEVTVREGRRRERGGTKADTPQKSSQPRKRGRKPGRRGRATPAFLATFPDDPELSPVVAAFERGDYAAVRQQAARLAKHAESKRVRRAARELLHRIEPDPLAKVLLLAAFALLLFLVIWAYAAH